MIYFDNAATTCPKPEQVLREVTRCLREYSGNPGRASHKLALAAANAVYSCREAICDEFGGQPENVIFTPNATYALNLAIKAFAKKASSGHILISPIEHNSVRRPVISLCGDGFEYSTFDVPACPCHSQTIVHSIKNSLRDDTKLIVCTHASNICGMVLPIREIGRLCRKRGIYFIVDASQSAGIYDINIGDDCIDALCCPGHKSLYGIQGSGFVLFSDNCASDGFWDGITITEGGSGSASLDEYMPGGLPEHFEAGTLSTPAIASLGAGLKFVSPNKEEFRYRKSQLIRRIRSVLMNTPRITVYAPHFDDSPILLFNIAGISPTETAARLDDAGICVRAGLHCSPLAHELLGTGDGGAVRISVGAFNTASEADEVCRKIRRMRNEK